MANIDQDLQAIMQARYGRDVRQSIHDAIYDMNVESTHAEEVAISSQSSAQNSAILAESYTKGGTSTRPGEDTDNSKYYKEFVERVAGNYTVEDSLNSTSAVNALSANQGRVLDGKITDVVNSKGSANGIASLDATGRVPSSQIPLSAMEYKGTWDASTNTPTLVQGTGTNGDFYVVSVAGTWDSTTFNVGDQLIFDADQGSTGLWVRVSGGNVISVNSQVGAVQIDADDVPFDGTGATVPLVSTDTQSAILEVLTKAGVQTYECTKAYYLAHKAELDASGKFIIVTDSGIANSAANVSFDNTGTDLANNVQGAIGDINTRISDNNRLSYHDLSDKVEYTCPCDGYCYVGMSSQSDGGFVDIKDATGTYLLGSLGSSIGTGYPNFATLVRKGMKLKATGVTGSPNLKFYGFKA